MKPRPAPHRKCQPVGVRWMRLFDIISWRAVRLFSRWVPDTSMEEFGAWRLVGPFGHEYARVRCDDSLVLRGKEMGKSFNQASAATWAETLLAIPKTNYENRH